MTGRLPASKTARTAAVMRSRLAVRLVGVIRTSPQSAIDTPRRIHRRRSRSYHPSAAVEPTRAGSAASPSSRTYCHHRDAARTASGPKRAPGRSVVPRSNGAPRKTTFDRASASSRGGVPKNVRCWIRNSEPDTPFEGHSSPAAGPDVAAPERERFATRVLAAIRMSGISVLAPAGPFAGRHVPWERRLSPGRRTPLPCWRASGTARRNSPNQGRGGRPANFVVSVRSGNGGTREAGVMHTSQTRADFRLGAADQQTRPAAPRSASRE